LLLPGERKSVEPMAARLAPDNVRRMHQPPHHFAADARWSDEAMLDRPWTQCCQRCPGKDPWLPGWPMTLDSSRRKDSTRQA
jgi:SRSO17 transposase